MQYWLWVFGDAQGLRWVLERSQMAFAENQARRAALARPAGPSFT